jgi:hypothetical protein
MTCNTTLQTRHSRLRALQGCRWRKIGNNRREQTTQATSGKAMAASCITCPAATAQDQAAAPPQQRVQLTTATSTESGIALALRNKPKPISKPAAISICPFLAQHQNVAARHGLEPHHQHPACTLSDGRACRPSSCRVVYSTVLQLPLMCS